jgi:hypothetical protein
MSKYKPLNLLNSKGFWPQKVAIYDAIKEILTLGKCRTPPVIQDFGRYRDDKWRNEKNELVPYHSVDWYVYDAMNEDRLQVDSDRILHSFSTEPWRRENLSGDHYDLFVMEEDMFDPAASADGAGTDYAVGKARKMAAAVISTHRIEHIWGMPYSYLKTEAMRQLCFMFGVPDARRADVTARGDRFYCTNRCILRPAFVAPDDWDALTADRVQHGSFCENCTMDLRRFFDQVAEEKR